jgi:hypothetical protein
MFYYNDKNFTAQLSTIPAAMACPGTQAFDMLTCYAGTYTGEYLASELWQNSKQRQPRPACHALGSLCMQRSPDPLYCLAVPPEFI